MENDIERHLSPSRLVIKKGAVEHDDPHGEEITDSCESDLVGTRVIMTVCGPLVGFLAAIG